jgi:WD40 repeat protein
MVRLRVASEKKNGSWSAPMYSAGLLGGKNFRPDGHVLAVTSMNGITLYEVPDGRAIKTLSGGGSATVRFSPDGLWLAQGGGNGIVLWNLSSLGK